MNIVPPYIGHILQKEHLKSKQLFTGKWQNGNLTSILEAPVAGHYVWYLQTPLLRVLQTRPNPLILLYFRLL